MSISRHHFYNFLGVGLTFLMVTLFGVLLFTQINPVTAQYKATEVRVRERVEFKFSPEVAPGFSYEISPAAVGSWEIQKSMTGVSSLSFQPIEPLDAGQKYTIHIQNLRRTISGAQVGEQEYSFTTEEPPAIAEVYPKDDAEEVPMQAEVKITLDRRNNQMRELELVSLDGLKLGDVQSSDDKVFTWKINDRLKQGEMYRFQLKDNKLKAEDKVIKSWRFNAVGEPMILPADDKGYFYPDSVVKIKFAQNMIETDSHLTFDMYGEGEWQDARTYEFKPSNLKPGTTYRYRVLKGAKSKAGGELLSDKIFTISTPGQVKATITPSGTGVGRMTPLTVQFDQPVDKKSAESRLYLYPYVPGEYSWQGNTMTWQTKGLNYQTTYTAYLAPGVIGVHGLPSSRAFSVSFRTELQTYKLSVPRKPQQYKLGSEVASLRMALAYRNVNTTELDILMKMGYSPKPRNSVMNVWDNPNSMFVGDVSGEQSSTGYGAYAPVIANAARSYNRTASAYKTISARTISEQIYAGNPVIVWGVSLSGSAKDMWHTTEGPIPTYRGMRARVVVGVVGSAIAPAGFYVDDPISGVGYWTTQQLMSNMNKYGSLSNQAVVVY